jgi:hypothetical protein
MKQATINLAEVRKSLSRVFSGQPRGKDARRHFQLDKLEQEADVIAVTIPQETYSISTSFLLGLFEPTIMKLGKEKFFEKYSFPWPRLLLDSVDETVDRVLKTSSVLGKIA